MNVGEWASIILVIAFIVYWILKPSKEDDVADDENSRNSQTVDLTPREYDYIAYEILETIENARINANGTPLIDIGKQLLNFNEDDVVICHLLSNYYGICMAKFCFDRYGKILPAPINKEEMLSFTRSMNGWLTHVKYINLNSSRDDIKIDYGIYGIYDDRVQGLYPPYPNRELKKLHYYYQYCPFIEPQCGCFIWERMGFDQQAFIKLNGIKKDSFLDYETVIIPEKIIGLPVKELTGCWREGLILSIPKTVNKIYEFNNNLKLKIDPENPYFFVVNNCIFSKGNCQLIAMSDYCNIPICTTLDKGVCTGITLKREFMIPWHVKCIKCGAFQKVKGIAGLCIWEGVEEIESFAFDDCDDIKIVHLPCSLRKVGERAFHHTRIEVVRIAHGVDMSLWDKEWYYYDYESRYVLPRIIYE